MIFLHIDFGEQIILGTNKTKIVNGENLYINIEHPEVYEKMNFDLLIENTKNDEIQKLVSTRFKMILIIVDILKIYQKENILYL